MATNEVPHTDFYKSTYVAEMLNSVNSLDWDGYEDHTVFWNALKDILHIGKSEHNADRIVVLDVATGPGRVLRNLANYASKQGEDLTQVDLIGLDSSPAMLEEAQKETSKISGVGSVQWLLGDANNLLAQPSLSSLKHQLDLVTFADGCIGYLYQPGETETFCSHVAQLLRPDSGRAFIALFEYQVTEAYKNGQKPSIYDESMDAMDQRSGDQSVVFTVKSLHFSERVENGTHIMDHKTAIMKKDEQGNEILLETNEYHHKNRVWGTEEFVQMAGKAGLELVEMKRLPKLYMFSFKVPSEANPGPN
ncbi:hypothetical protein N7510_005802 [Penicillium lagena]|uniref:uncharacterized protein n=1 Tax=Penicillium lagena TaxID=94218 RepID=UPI002541DA5F|nr:uncharacterized protein N7510_005802 [Penicillium lagena]KAJ5612608.1 hypothetical protein N7510_005802 [Penicillium lagena]